MSGQLICDDVENSAFEAMRSQSRPSVDSRSLVEYCAANEGSPLEYCYKGAAMMVWLNQPSLCLVCTKSPVFKTNSFSQAFQFFGFHWGF